MKAHAIHPLDDHGIFRADRACCILALVRRATTPGGSSVESLSPPIALQPGEIHRVDPMTYLYAQIEYDA